MPTYQYACTVCDERLEAVQSFTDAPLKQCPVCSGALRKVFSAVGVVFKGSGFYKNDSRDAPKKKEPVPAAAGASSSDSGGSAGPGSGGKESGGKDSGSKDSGGRGSGGKDSSNGGSRGNGRPSGATPAASGKPAERKSA